VKFEKAWRWFGPEDPVPLRFLRQVGVESVVTALHSRAPGEAWSAGEIGEVKTMIEDAGMRWKVVESLPVAEGIKLRDDSYDRLVENYRASLAALGQAGIETVVYNFMPVLDWVRTDLRYRLPSGGQVMRFDPSVFAAFDIHILKRPGAEASYSEGIAKRAGEIFSQMSEDQREELAYHIIVYTQGFINGNVSDSRDYKRYFRSLLSAYQEIDEAGLRENLLAFLEDILPVAESYGITMAIHPDDPPMPVLGLPRIVKNASDLDAIFTALPSSANGLTFCSGSLSAVEQDVAAMAERFAGRIAFLHLRNTRKSPDGSFHESGHLDGDLNMPDIIARLIASDRSGADRLVPLRPDHGVAILGDLDREAPPGYPLYGRLVGMAELFAVEAALRAQYSQARP
jgi:mannonate dehydratase